MRTIKASEFKAKCLQLIDEVAASGESIEITKRGKPLARLVTRPSLPANDHLAAFRTLFPADSMTVNGAPLAPSEGPWDEWGDTELRLDSKFTDLPLPSRR
jgi:prevent-host-death family protein